MWMAWVSVFGWKSNFPYLHHHQLRATAKRATPLLDGQIVVQI